MSATAAARRPTPGWDCVRRGVWVCMGWGGRVGTSICIHHVPTCQPLCASPPQSSQAGRRRRQPQPPPNSIGPGRLGQRGFCVYRRLHLGCRPQLQRGPEGCQQHAGLQGIGYLCLLGFAVPHGHAHYLKRLRARQAALQLQWSRWGGGEFMVLSGGMAGGAQGSRGRAADRGDRSLPMEYCH